jgi:hypothetical protein
MNPPKQRSHPWRLTGVVGWFGLVAVVYLFCMGPVCRWFPQAAEIIYAPLSPLADWRVVGPAMRRWIAFWGVDVGEEDMELDKKP